MRTYSFAFSKKLMRAPGTKTLSFKFFNLCSSFFISGKSSLTSHLKFLNIGLLPNFPDVSFSYGILTISTYGLTSNFFTTGFSPLTAISVSKRLYNPFFLFSLLKRLSISARYVSISSASTVSLLFQSGFFKR